MGRQRRRQQIRGYSPDYIRAIMNGWSGLLWRSLSSRRPWIETWNSWQNGPLLQTDVFEDINNNMSSFLETLGHFDSKQGSVWDWRWHKEDRGEPLDRTSRNRFMEECFLVGGAMFSMSIHYFVTRALSNNPETFAEKSNHQDSCDTEFKRKGGLGIWWTTWWTAAWEEAGGKKANAQEEISLRNYVEKGSIAQVENQQNHQPKEGTWWRNSEKKNKRKLRRRRKARRRTKDIYNRITQWNANLLSSDSLKRYADAVARRGAALQNCFGFVDGTVRPICRPGENQRIVYNGHKRVHALKFQSVTLPNGIIANMYGPVGK